MNRDNLGQRIKSLRVQRRMTQTQLAEAAEVSADLISKLEQGKRLSARLATLMGIAHALDVPIWQLMGTQPGLVAAGEDQEMLKLRQAVLNLVPIDVEAPTLNVLEQTLARLWELYFDGRYAQLSRDLPAAITTARAAVRDAYTGDVPKAYGLLSELLQMSAELFTHLSHTDLGHVALLGAMEAAKASGDELLFASQQATRSWMLSRQGLWGEAGSLAVATAREVEPVLSSATIEQLAVWGELLRYANLAEARAKRHDEAADLLGLMQAAADRMGSDRRSRYSVIRFGPTMTAMRAVDNAIQREDYQEALRLAERVEHPDRVPPAIHSRYLLSVAWAQVETWESAKAVATLLKAEAVAPQTMPYQGIARSTVEALLPRRRKQRLPGLAGFAERIGVSAD